MQFVGSAMDLVNYFFITFTKVYKWLDISKHSYCFILLPLFRIHYMSLPRNKTDEEKLIFFFILMFYFCICKLFFPFSSDKRFMLVVSALCFIAYHLFTLPWQFYDGPLDYISIG